MLLVVRGQERETYEIAFDLPVFDSAETSTKGYAEDVVVAIVAAALIAQCIEVVLEVAVKLARPDETISRRVRVINTPSETINRRSRP